MADINQVITLGIGTPAGIPEFILLGLQPAGGAYTIVFEQGSYTLTGQDHDLIVDRVLTFAQGSYTYTGQDYGLLTGASITFEAGNYTLTGQDIDLILALVLDFEQGNYTLTGQTFNLLYSGDTTPTPTERICTIATENRIYSIVATDEGVGQRTYAVTAEDRTYPIS